MAIIDLQRRLREAGRIRIGQQVPTGNGRTRPEKLTTFRITSRDRTVVDQAATRWGGTVNAWQSPDGNQWEVVTTVDELAVVVPPGEMSFSQFYETWSAGGCRKRCDGQWDQQRDTACDCDPEDRECSIHSRLSVLLPDLGGVGLYRLDTSGYYAAVELAGAVDLCRMVAGDVMLPGRLRLEQRSVKREGADGKVQTRRFAVPVLDFDVPLGALAAAGTPVQIEAARDPGFQPVPASLGTGPERSIAEQSVPPPPRPKRVNSAPPIPPTGLEPRTAAEAEVASFADSESRIDTTPEPPDTDRALKAFMAECGNAFAEQRALAPDRMKTKTADRCRHALIWAKTARRTMHANELTVEELSACTTRARDISTGRMTVEVTDEAVVFTLNGNKTEVLFAEIEPA